VKLLLEQSSSPANFQIYKPKYHFKTMNGVIKKKTDKGFGFITSPELGKDLFFHSNSLVGVSFDQLQEGDNVSFESEESPKGLNAVNVTLA